MQKMMDPNLIDYYIINCAKPLKITIKNSYQIDFGNPESYIAFIDPCFIYQCFGTQLRLPT